MTEAPLTASQMRAILREQASEILAHRGMGPAFRKKHRLKRGGRSRGPVAQLFAPEHPLPTRSVYVVGCAGHPIKIGIAQDVADRVIGLQVGFPHTLRVYYQVEIPDGRAREVERLCHQRLSAYRTRGEWFAIDPYEGVDAVKAVIAETLAA